MWRRRYQSSRLWSWASRHSMKAPRLGRSAQESSPSKREPRGYSTQSKVQSAFAQPLLSIDPARPTVRGSTIRKFGSPWRIRSSSASPLRAPEFEARDSVIFCEFSAEKENSAPDRVAIGNVTTSCGSSARKRLRSLGEKLSRELGAVPRCDAMPASLERFDAKAMSSSLRDKSSAEHRRGSTRLQAHADYWTRGHAKLSRVSACSAG